MILALTTVDYQEKLAKELEIFRAVFNIRVKYFSALQEISDSVSLIDSLGLIVGYCAASKESP